ncbi:TniB family NTP-binding protein [Litoreibacter roseus]|uniref:TniB protein n=1 Tax=Litoreibacter roseus TaxID=2601869 RepID=A0A6N6JGK8_9RHOB|nr:TniB family NTP-binding protein [Litoreibacter roseus]GFE65107.1 hypothetical protein KIN_21810 [Litoreibacter roseus]
MSFGPKHPDVYSRHQKLRQIFMENPDAERIFHAIGDVVGEHRAAVDAGSEMEARAVAILGNSGTGKTKSTIHGLERLGLKDTVVGDNPRSFLVIKLKAKASLRGLCAGALTAYGWPVNKRDSAEEIWTEVDGYIRKLQTSVLVFDEIQHVRSAGAVDRADLRDFLKSLVQPGQSIVIPIVVGTPDFLEVLNSDDQLFRRCRQVHTRTLETAIDLEVVARTLNQYAKAANIQLTKSVKNREFAARLLHVSKYAFGTMCEYCCAGIKQAMLEDSTELKIQHFEDTYRRNIDCVPALNPFVAADFQNIQIGEKTDFR